MIYVAWECFICILIPACTHLTMGVKYKQPKLMTILVQVNVLLHVPRLNLHASDHFVTSRRPRQVRACRFFTEQNRVYSDPGTSLCHVFTLPFPTVSRAARRLKSGVARNQHSPPNLPSRNQSANEPQLFSLVRRCATGWLHVFAHSRKRPFNGTDSCWHCQTQSDIYYTQQDLSSGSQVVEYTLTGHAKLHQRCQPSALCNINRSAIGARIVVDCTQGVVNRLLFVAGRWKKERRRRNIEQRTG